MTTTDDARLVEIEAFLSAWEKGLAPTRGRVEIDMRYLLDRLKAAESRIRELEEALRLMRSSDLVLSDTHDPYTCEQPSCVLARRLLDEVQEEGNGGAEHH